MSSDLKPTRQWPTWTPLIFGILFLVHPVAADDYPKNYALDVDNYRFKLELFDGERRIEGKTTVSLDVVGDEVATVVFDLHGRSGEEPSAEGYPVGEGMVVSAVTVNGQEARYSHENHRLSIPVSDSAKGHRLIVEIEYAGIPADALGIGPNKHGVWSWFSDNWPNKARHWLPTVDHPYDKATSEMIVTAPDRVQVISNGLLIEERDLGNDRRLTHWRQSVPISTWLYTLGVTEFAVQHLPAFATASGSVPVQTWVFAQDRDAGFYDFAEPTHHAMAFYTDFVGPYSYEKLANVQSARTKGGMEAATAIMYDDRSVTGERSKRWRNVVIHEIAHQWFGNAVTEADWDDVWLSEGFATYFTLLFIEHAYGRDEFAAGLESSRETIFRLYENVPEHRIVHDNLTDMSKVTTGNTYQKGAWILHMLRSMVGDEVFWRGIRKYYHQYQDKSATTADFRRVMETESGVSLQWFFDQWLRRPGLPRLQWSHLYDSATKKLIIEVEQVQQEEPFRLRLPVEVTSINADSGERNTRLEILELDRRSQTFELDRVTPQYEVRLDPKVQTLQKAELLVSN